MGMNFVTVAQHIRQNLCALCQCDVKVVAFSAQRAINHSLIFNYNRKMELNDTSLQQL